eukprot:3174346-Rhodomonas_salina.1
MTTASHSLALVSGRGAHRLRRGVPPRQLPLRLAEEAPASPRHHPILRRARPERRRVLAVRLALTLSEHKPRPRPFFPPRQRAPKVPAVPCQPPPPKKNSS